jgi:hypothetical protein
VLVEPAPLFVDLQRVVADAAWQILWPQPRRRPRLTSPSPSVPRRSPMSERPATLADPALALHAVPVHRTSRAAARRDHH